MLINLSSSSENWYTLRFRPLKGTNSSPANRYGTAGPGGSGVGTTHSPKIYTNDLNTYGSTAPGGGGGSADPYYNGPAGAGTDMMYDNRRRMHSASAEPDYARSGGAGAAATASGRLSRMRDGSYGNGSSQNYNATYSQQNGCNITSNIGM